MTRFGALVTVVAVFGVPALALATEQPDILASAERAAVRFAAEQAGDEEPTRRRSMARTWGGVALIGVGLVIPIQQEKCAAIFGISACVTEMYTPGVVAAVGLIGAGVMLATVWADVPANAVDLRVAPDRIEIGKTLGF